MTDKVYSHLKRRYNETFSLEPNTLHSERLTRLFKAVSVFLKVFPFRIVVPIAILAAIVLYVILGPYLIRLVSLLQYGF